MWKEPLIYNTAVEATLAVIDGKWKPVMLFHLVREKKRMLALKRLIPGISQKVLTDHSLIINK